MSPLPAAVESAQRRLGPVARVRIAAEVLGTYAHVRRIMRRRQLRDALAQLRPLGGTPATVDGPLLHRAVRLGRIVQRTLRPLPADTRCLMQSLTLSAMLSRRGIPSRLIIAVKPGSEDADAGFGAHAWVELGDRPVLPTLEFARLTEL